MSYFHKGYKLVKQGLCKHYHTLCYFLSNGPDTIELCVPYNDKSPIKKFVDKNGEGKIHHIAFLNKHNSIIDGALDNMKIKFYIQNGTLIEEVYFK